MRMKKYVVIDFEMCRVPLEVKCSYHNKQEIIQIGAALMSEDYIVVDTFNEYVSPQYGYVDSYIRNLTGISGKDLYGADHIDTVMGRFLDWLPDEDVIFISWSDNDCKQLRKELQCKEIVISERLEHIFETWVDCQPLFSEKLHSKKRYSLEEALVAADICTEGRAHDGMIDAYNTALLYAKMQKEDELVLNEDYRKAHYGEALEGLTYSLADIIKAAGF